MTSSASGPHVACCKTTDCGLPVADGRERCRPCARVLAAMFALYDRLLERDAARLETETPGFLEAMRRWLASPVFDRTGQLQPAIDHDPVALQQLQDAGVPTGWQVDRLEEFVAELREIAFDPGRTE